MTYVFIQYDCYSLPLAYHLQQEGHEVIIGSITYRSQLTAPGIVNDEHPKDREERLSNYNGMLKKYSLGEVLTRLRNVPASKRDDYFIFFDYNDLYKISERVMAMGFRNGLFPTKQYYELEKERIVAKRLVEKHYKEIRVADYQVFKKVKDGIEYIRESENPLVLKSNGNEGNTVVPKSDDIEIAHEQLIAALEKTPRDYEKNGFLLEKKIKDCIELTPVIVFYNGEPVYSICEFENKQYGAGNIGAQKGGNQVVSIHTEFDAKINKMAFPDVVYDMAKKQRGLSIYDAGLLYDGKNFYFGEYCAMRYGFDGLYSEIVMRDDGKPFAAKYFEDIVAGKNPCLNKYGVAVRIFNYEGSGEDTKDPVGNKEMTWDAEIDNYLFLYAAKKNSKGQIVDTADRDFIACVTGAGDSLKSSVGVTYDRVDKFNFEMIMYRPRFDFLSKDYRSSIPNRIEQVREYL